MRPPERKQATEAPRSARGASLLLALTFLAAACAPPATAIPQATSTVAAASHAPEIRFALIGEISEENVWALFGGQGYSYNNYAARARYWPRLYAASIPDQVFVPVAASGPPSDLRQEGIFHTAIVPIRSDLRWTDATPFTAHDVAFTVNTALKFELGFDWHDHFDPEWLDHAEALSPEQVKFYYKRAPGIDAWQYGALQAPVVQEHFWASKVAAAAQSLPPDELRAGIEELRSEITTLQQEVNEIYSATLAARGEEARELQAEHRRQQGNLDEATNDLAEKQAALEAGMHDARLSLFRQGDQNEPLLGPWLPDEALGNSPSASEIVNVANPDFPGPAPNFDRAVYHIYPTREAAERALAAGEVNVVLDPRPGQSFNSPLGMTSPTRSLRFLLLNLNADSLGEAVLRRALACVVDQAELAYLLEGRAAPLASFVPQGEAWWHNPQAHLPCAGRDAASRMAEAVESLKAGGYSWNQEPSRDTAGQGLQRPDGLSVTALRLLAPSSDETRLAAATYVARQGLMLGIPISLVAVEADVIDYAVLSSGEYDMAILGWKASAYPRYLCDWFGAGRPFHHDPTMLTSLCGELLATSDLEKARSLMFDMQSALADEVPMLPLYSTLIHDYFRGVAYPFSALPDGLAGVYGVPELAFPTAP